jgi:photosystem II stability/assembly factor-like uncharacterized protein
VILVASVSYSQEGWYAQTSSTSKPLFDVHFADNQTGWIASITNSILFTSNSGDTWADLNPPPSVNYWAIRFVSTLEGYAVGNNGTIRHTTDAGITWVDQSSGVSYNLWDVYFLDENNGWIAGGRERQFNQDPIRYIIHTTNGGTNWNTQLYDFNEPQLFAIHFFDTGIGFAVGDVGTIFHTSNGGTTWSQQTSGTLNHLRGVHATSPDTAWIVGRGGVLLKTTNGGLAWDSLYTGVSQDFSDIFFVDSQTGWIAGGDTTHGTVLHTSDGGNSWNIQNTGTSNFLYSIHFTDPNNGWAVGYDGTIIHTTTGGVGVMEKDESEFGIRIAEFGLAQNTPNPFHRLTAISYQLKATSHTTLEVYDISGRLVETLVDERQKAGIYQLPITDNQLPGSGIYFYRLTSRHTDGGQAGKFTATRKLILLK